MAQPGPPGSRELVGALQAADPHPLLTPAAPMPSSTPGLRASSVGTQSVWLPLVPTPVLPGDGDAGDDGLSPNGTGMLGCLAAPQYAWMLGVFS